MLSTPPLTTHKLQPLDRVFFKPFKRAYGSASALWMRHNPSTRLTKCDVAGLISTAFTKVARLEIAQNGFAAPEFNPSTVKFFRTILSRFCFDGFPANWKSS